MQSVSEQETLCCLKRVSDVVLEVRPPQWEEAARADKVQYAAVCNSKIHSSTSNYLTTSKSVVADIVVSELTLHTSELT